MGRESPNFLHSEQFQGLPDMQPLPGPLSLPPSAAEHHLWASRMQNLTGINPMLALQQQSALSGLAAHYMHGKIPASFGGLFAGYMMNGPPVSMAPSMTMGAPLAGAPLGLMQPTRLTMEHESLDMRKSSIDALRMKAKEHSIDHRLFGSTQEGAKS